jgi:uncharacterized alpha-E superfamily protein
MDPRGIARFLILDERFPRSLSFCYQALRDNLAELARVHGREGRSNELMREADQGLSSLTIRAIFDRGLHEFLLEFIASNRAIADAIAEDYRFTG